MAARLNKKFFGNRNIGTGGDQTTGNLSNSQNYNDDRIGGEGVASVTINTEGTYTSALPTVLFSTPDIPGGVRATGTVHGHALTAVATAAGSGYNLNDTLTQTTGGTGVAMATWTVTGLTVVGITLNNGGSANDTGDIFEYTHSSLSSPLRVRVTSSTAGLATGVEIVSGYGGIWTTGSLPGNTGVGGFTRTQVFGSSDMNGVGLQINFTAWGVGTVAVATQGDYTAITSGAKATSVTPSGGSSATLTITYGVSGVVVDEKGSGYSSVSDAAPTFSVGAAAGTSVLTTDNGIPYSAGNQENALIPYAYIGGSRKIVDIVGQKGARRYKVTDGSNVGLCNLKTSGAASADGEMDLTAYDSAGGEYWVKKINNRRCTVVRKSAGGGTQFATDSSVPWTLDAATLNTTVKINNA